MACTLHKQETTATNVTSLYGGSYTRAGQKETVSNKTICKVEFNLCKVGSPTGTAYARIRKTSDDGILETSSDTLDVSTITTCWTQTWYAFTFNQLANEEVRFLIEYTGGDGSNYVNNSLNASDTISGCYTRYSGSYTDSTGYDCTVKVYEETGGGLSIPVAMRHYRNLRTAISHIPKPTVTFPKLKPRRI